MNQLIRPARGGLAAAGVPLVGILAIGLLPLGVVGVGVVGLATPAYGQVDPAEAHYKTGQAYYQRGAYADAIGEFKRAYKLSKRPELLYNIGQAYERLGDVQRAVSHFERYLKAGVKNEALVYRIENLRRRLRHTGIRINTRVAGAVVTVDGKQVGTTPLKAAVSVPPGQHKVRVTKAGYTAYGLAVSVVAGSVVSIDADLQPVGGEASGAAQPAADDGGTAATAAPKRGRLWTWVALGTGGALIVGGAVTGGLALSKANAAATPDGSKADAAKTLGAVTDVLLIAGAAAAITGAVLFFFEGRGEQPARARLIPTPTLGPGFAGVAAVGSF